MRPSARALKLIAIWAASGLLVALTQWLGWDWLYHNSRSLWWLSSAVLLLLLLLDGREYFHLSKLEVGREVNENMALGNPTAVALSIQHPFTRPLQVQVADHFPASGEVSHRQWAVLLKPGEQSHSEYRFTPKERGEQLFKGVDLLYPSSLGLWEFRRFKALPSPVKVFPNYAAVSGFSLLSMAQRQRRLGIRQMRKRGEGLEFHQLREFRQGDSLRQINWNSSAKFRKLISKDYQEEVNQEMVFLLDCGRKMRNQDDELSHFDHALNALLITAYMALKQGDAVGCLSFSGQQRWLPPVKNVSSMGHLLNHVYDLQATTRAADYLAAAENLLAQHKKRALLVLITNLRDENTDHLLPALKLLRKKHLVLLANLEEPFLLQTQQQPVTDFDQAMAYLGAVDYQQKRKQLNSQLQQQNIILVNCQPKELASALVNEYLAIKREGIL